MSQTRRINARAVSKSDGQERIRMNIDALIVVQPGHLTKDEVNGMRRVVASKLMLFLANEVPYLNVHLSEIKVTR